MLKGTLVALAAILALALTARAESREANRASLLPPSPVTSTEFAQEVTTVESRPTTGGIIARDAIGGAVAGAAVAGGVILWRRYVESNGTWGNWERDLALGAGIGLAAGLIFGAVDAASNADRRFTGAVVDERQSGFAPAVATYGRRF
jgi:hypothetical protein